MIDQQDSKPAGLASRTLPWIPLAIVLLLSSSAPLAAQDTIEFLSGAKVNGKVVRIDRDGKKVEFESKIGTQTRRRVYAYSRIHAVKYKGKRYVLNKKSSTGRPGSNSGGPVRRTPREVLRVIQTIGSTPPDWLESTRLNYPRTLDLSWPVARSSGWNTRKHLGHFLWSVINENPRRWREGVKLMYHVRSINGRNGKAKTKAELQLGEQFHNLFQDYARAAYWYRQAGVDKRPPKIIPMHPFIWRNVTGDSEANRWLWRCSTESPALPRSSWSRIWASSKRLWV